MLLTEIYSVLAAEEPDGQVAVSATVRDGDIAFQVDHHSSDGELGGLHTLAGRPLTRACAAALLAPQGGCVEVSEREGSTRVSFVVPASSPSRQ